MASTSSPQVWRQRVEGREHRVESTGSFIRKVRWFVDDELVGEKKTTDEKIRLKADGVGRLLVVHTRLGRPRRATVHGPDASALSLSDLGGTDLEPAQGSPAAAYEERVLAHPRRYALLQTLGGVGSVVVPLLVAALLVRFFVAIPWPDWSVPLPDLPSVPFPDLPDVSLPGWLQWVLDNGSYVWPVLLAMLLAGAEIKRRRTQAERRRAEAERQRTEAREPE